jgi:hypothetical protein
MIKPLPSILARIPAPDELSVLLDRWFVDRARYDAYSDRAKEILMENIRRWEAQRLRDISDLRRLAGENWEQYIDERERVTEAGRRLLEERRRTPAWTGSSDPFETLFQDKTGPAHESLRKSIDAMASGTAAGLEKIASPDASAERAGPVFDGSRPGGMDVPGTAVPVLNYSAAGAAGFEYFKALSLAHEAASTASTAKSLGQMAAALGRQASSLGAQAQAAAAAGHLAQAQALAGQAQLLRAQALSSGANAKALAARAASAKDAALGAEGLAKVFVIVGGALSILDGLWDVYKGLTSDPSGGERTAVGGVKILGGVLQLLSLAAAAAAPYLLLAGILTYTAALVYQHRHGIADFFRSIGRWVGGLF